MLAAASITPAKAGWFDSDKAPPLSMQFVATQTLADIDGYPLNGEEIKTFYAAQAFKAMWTTEADNNALQKSFSSTLSFANDQGLFPNQQAVALINRLMASTAPVDRVKLELVFTNFILQLAHDLHGDDIDLAPLYPGWTFKREPADIAGGLASAAAHDTVSDYIASLAPKSPAYADLLNALKLYRGFADKGEWQKVDGGPALKLNMRDTRVGQMRARLAAEGYAVDASAPDTNDVYDAGLQEAVKSFQERHGLRADGDVGARSIMEMNVPVASRATQIIANLERWRHMPEAVPARYVSINIPSAWLEYFDDNKLAYSGSVIVGRPDRKTPFINSAIRSVIFNPAWHVPTKIARKDILPKLRKDPHYLEKMGFVINGSADDPYGATVDWNKIKESAFNFRLRQSPGDMNSLGRIKFDFDNDFAVYMHGTPHEELFNKPERFFSSGCVRLHDPEQVAQIVLSRNASVWDAQSVHNEVEKGTTRWLKVAEALPVYFVYWTVFDDNGVLNFRRDIYDYDAFLIENLHDAVVAGSTAEENQNNKKSQ